MRLFPPEPVIGLTDGFNKHDIFGYEKFGERLKDFYEKFDDPLVGVLDAPWGSGKSTFIKMWCGYMRNEGYPVIEFDAFKNDYTDDAFMALAGEVLLLAEEQNGDAEEVRNEFVERATNVIVAAGKGGLKALARKAFTEEGADEIGETLVGASDGAIDSLEAAVKEKLLSRKQEKAAFDSFAEALSTLSEQLGKSEVKGEKSKPLIFVIDELDRCKPTFALALLEKIKHFFSVPNVHFLLVTNLSQLSEVVKSQYGRGVNGKKYLQKFYTLCFALPDRKVGVHDVVDIFCEYLNEHCETYLDYKELSGLVCYKKVSLRDVLKIHAYAAIMSKQRSAENDLYNILYIGLACMRVTAPSLFEKALNNTMRKEDVEEFFSGDALYVEGFRHVFLLSIGCLDREDDIYRKAFRMKKRYDDNFLALEARWFYLMALGNNHLTPT